MHLRFKREKQRKQHLLHKQCLYPVNGASRWVVDNCYIIFIIILFFFSHLISIWLTSLMSFTFSYHNLHEWYSWTWSCCFFFALLSFHWIWWMENDNGGERELLPFWRDNKILSLSSYQNCRRRCLLWRILSCDVDDCALIMTWHCEICLRRISIPLHCIAHINISIYLYYNNDMICFVLCFCSFWWNFVWIEQQQQPHNTQPHACTLTGNTGGIWWKVSIIRIQHTRFEYIIDQAMQWTPPKHSSRCGIVQWI